MVKMLFSGEGTSLIYCHSTMRNLSSDKILIRCDSFRRAQPLLASCGVILHNLVQYAFLLER